jgi:hypothetical protein
MRLAAAAVVALAALTNTVVAGPPTAAQKNTFHRVCMSIASNEPLCACKADAAVKLIDSDFIELVISAMKGETYPADEQGRYDEYIRRSNAICIPGY